MKRTLLIFKKLLELTEKNVGCLICDLTAVLSVNNIVTKKTELNYSLDFVDKGVHFKTCQP